MSTPALNTVRWSIVRRCDVSRKFYLRYKGTQKRPIDISSWTDIRLRLRPAAGSGFYFERSVTAGTIVNGGVTGCIEVKFGKDESLPLGTFYGDLVALAPTKTAVLRVELNVEETNDDPPNQDVSIDILGGISGFQTSPLGIEAAQRVAGDAALSSAVSTEASARASVDVALSSSISTEAAARASADISLSAAVSLEESARVLAVNSLSTACATEATARASADTSLAAAVSVEAAARISSDVALSTACSTESAARAAADASLSAAVSAEATARASLTASLSAETSRAATAEQSLATALAAEATARDDADAALDVAIDAEITARLSADASIVTSVQGALSQEASLRSAINTAYQSADTSLSTAVSTETSARISGDASLSTRLSSEESTRAAVDASKAPIASPTFTGTVTVVSEILTSSGFLKFGNGSGQVFTWHNGSAATAKNHYIMSANVPRWAWIYSADGAGGNAGADLTGLCYDDAGASLGSWLSVTRATRAVLFPGALTVTGLATMNGGAKIGSSGATIASVLTAVATLDFPSIPSGGSASLQIMCTGAVSNSAVVLGLSPGAPAGVLFTAFVVSADTVNIRATNVLASAIDPASATVRVTVFNH